MNENEIHLRLCTYLKSRYPNVIFTTESSGLRVTPWQGRNLANVRSCSGLPDIWILEPRGEYKGLFLELKKLSPFKKNGELKKSDHLRKQYEVLSILCEKGYHAQFTTGLEESKACVDWYMTL